MTLHYTLFFIGWLLFVVDVPFLAIWIDPAISKRMAPPDLLLSAHMVAPIIAVGGLVLAVCAWHWCDAGDRRYAVNTILFTAALFLLYLLPWLVGSILPAIGPGLDAYTWVVVIAICASIVLVLGLVAVRIKT